MGKSQEAPIVEGGVPLMEGIGQGVPMEEDGEVGVKLFINISIMQRSFRCVYLTFLICCFTVPPKGSSLYLF